MRFGDLYCNPLLLLFTARASLTLRLGFTLVAAGPPESLVRRMGWVQTQAAGKVSNRCRKLWLMEQAAGKEQPWECWMEGN